MADSFDINQDESYQETNSYRMSSPARRRQMNRYKKECGISDEHMHLLLLREELDAVPKSDVDSADTMGRIVLIVGVLLFWGSMQTAMGSTGANKLLGYALSIGSFLLAVAVFYTGVLNPYKRADRQLKKLLKGKPEVPDFQQWCLDHPDKEDVKAQKAYKRRRR